MALEWSLYVLEKYEKSITLIYMSMHD